MFFGKVCKVCVDIEVYELDLVIGKFGKKVVKLFIVMVKVGVGEIVLVKKFVKVKKLKFWGLVFV